MAKVASLKWYETWQAFVVRAALGVVLAYAFASLAIDSGSLLQYFVGFVLLGLAVRYTVRALQKFRHGN